MEHNPLENDFNILDPSLIPDALSDYIDNELLNMDMNMADINFDLDIFNFEVGKLTGVDNNLAEDCNNFLNGNNIFNNDFELHINDSISKGVHPKLALAGDGALPNVIPEESGISAQALIQNDDDISMINVVDPVESPKENSVNGDGTESGIGIDVGSDMDIMMDFDDDVTVDNKVDSMGDTNGDSNGPLYSDLQIDLMKVSKNGNIVSKSSMKAVTTEDFLVCDDNNDDSDFDDIIEYPDVPKHADLLVKLCEDFNLPKDYAFEFANFDHIIHNPFYEKEALKILIETNDLYCNVCGMVFEKNSVLRRHLQKHLQRRRYMCILCYREFHELYDATRHIRSHTGIRPYRCSLCAVPKAFTQLHGLESHIERIHCIVSDYKFKQKRTKFNICEKCGNIYRDIFKYQNHMKEKHNIVVDLVEKRKDKAAKRPYKRRAKGATAKKSSVAKSK